MTDTSSSPRWWDFNEFTPQTPQDGAQTPGTTPVDWDDEPLHPSVAHQADPGVALPDEADDETAVDLPSFSSPVWETVEPDPVDEGDDPVADWTDTGKDAGRHDDAPRFGVPVSDAEMINWNVDAVTDGQDDEALPSFADWMAPLNGADPANDDSQDMGGHDPAPAEDREETPDVIVNHGVVGDHSVTADQSQAATADQGASFYLQSPKVEPEAFGDLDDLGDWADAFAAPLQPTPQDVDEVEDEDVIAFWAAPQVHDPKAKGYEDDTATNHAAIPPVPPPPPSGDQEGWNIPAIPDFTSDLPAPPMKSTPTAAGAGVPVPPTFPAPSGGDDGLLAPPPPPSTQAVPPAPQGGSESDDLVNAGHDLGLLGEDDPTALPTWMVTTNGGPATESAEAVASPIEDWFRPEPDLDPNDDAEDESLAEDKATPSWGIPEVDRTPTWSKLDQERSPAWGGETTEGAAEWVPADTNRTLGRDAQGHEDGQGGDEIGAAPTTPLVPAAPIAEDMVVPGVPEAPTVEAFEPEITLLAPPPPPPPGMDLNADTFPGMDAPVPATGTDTPLGEPGAVLPHETEPVALIAEEFAAPFNPVVAGVGSADEAQPPAPPPTPKMDPAYLAEQAAKNRAPIQPSWGMPAPSGIGPAPITSPTLSHPSPDGSPATTTPLVTAKKATPKSTLILVGLLATAILGGAIYGGYWAYQSYGPNADAGTVAELSVGERTVSFAEDTNLQQEWTFSTQPQEAFAITFETASSMPLAIRVTDAQGEIIGAALPLDGDRYGYRYVAHNQLGGEVNVIAVAGSPLTADMQVNIIPFAGRAETADGVNWPVTIPANQQATINVVTKNATPKIEISSNDGTVLGEADSITSQDAPELAIAQFKVSAAEEVQDILITLKGDKAFNATSTVMVDLSR